MKPLSFVNAVDKLESTTWLDPVAKTAGAVAGAVLRPQWLRDILHGVPQGHPLHPPLVQVPLGTWLSAAVLDAVPGTQGPVTLLVGVGVLAAVPAAAAGFTDFGELHEQQKRVAVVHSSLNMVAVGLYATSWLARRGGRHRLGKQLSYAGLGVAGIGGFLGGHLSFRQASGANHAEDVAHRVEPGWHSIGRLEDLAEGELQVRQVGQIPVTVFRLPDRGQGTQEQVLVLSDVCSHLSGPLHEGDVVDGGPKGPCVQCPWHGSVFALRDGQVMRGPATARQPSFRTRIQGDDVQVCLPGAG